MPIDTKKKFISLNFCIAVISDTRSINDDKSGLILEQKIIQSGHTVYSKEFIKDDSKKIIFYIKECLNLKNINMILLTGGTGLTGRDSTPEAVKKVIEKEIPGFGEIFRMISFEKIGASAIQSRAIAGIARDKFIFAIPGSPSACSDAWENILKYQCDNRFKPCNLVELIPRLLEK